MEMRDDTTARSASFGIVVVGLVAISAGLVAMLVITTQAAFRTTDPAARKLLARLAWLSLALLCLAVVMVIWCVLRRIRYHVRSQRLPKSSEYVNAWELAGKRFKLPDEPEDDSDPEGHEL